MCDIIDNCVIDDRGLGSDGFDRYTRNTGGNAESFVQLQQICTAGSWYGTEWDETETPTIEDCARKCPDDLECVGIAYGTESGFDATSFGGAVSDGFRANDCMFVSDLSAGFVNPACRFNVYSVSFQEVTFEWMEENWTDVLQIVVNQKEIMQQLQM
eukprot:UN22218